MARRRRIAAWVLLWGAGCSSEATKPDAPATSAAPVMPAAGAPMPPAGLDAGAGAGAAAGPVAEPTEPKTPRKTSTGLTYETITPGTGPSAKFGDRVTVHYASTLADGKPVEDTRKAGPDPFAFKIGEDRVVLGMNEGVAGMKVGETRKLTVPANLAYGALGKLPEVPPNSGLVIVVELIGIQGD